MKNSKYRYCGSHSDIESFEDLVSKISDKENHSPYSEEDCQECNKSRNCSSCRRNESLRYCGASFPEIGVYTGDHYDDVITAIINYFNEL